MKYVIGDIHGCLDKLQALLDKISLKAGDKLIFLGDYIDRGPDSFRVVELLIRLREKGKQHWPEVEYVFLKGNHEQMLLDYVHGCSEEKEELFAYNGGLETIKSYLTHGGIDITKPVVENSKPLPAGHLEFYESLVSYHEDAEYIYVHGGVRKPSHGIENVPEDVLLWDRVFCEYGHREYCGPKPIIVGHTPHTDVVIKDFFMCIDTGAVFKGKLTAIELPSRNIFQA